MKRGNSLLRAHMAVTFPSIVQVVAGVSLLQLTNGLSAFLQASCSVLMLWDKSLIAVLARRDLMAALQG